MISSNEERVTQQLADLRERYDDVPVEREDPPFEATPEHFRRLAKEATEGTINSSYLWVRRRPDQFPSPSFSLDDRAEATNTRVLFITDRADDYVWSLPGGGQESGESLEEAAHRELDEETGITALIAGVRRVQHGVAVPSEPISDSELDEVHALSVIFDGDYESGELDIQLEELYGAAWFDRVPDNRHDRIADESLTSRVRDR